MQNSILNNASRTEHFHYSCPHTGRPLCAASVRLCVIVFAKNPMGSVAMGNIHLRLERELGSEEHPGIQHWVTLQLMR